MRALLTLCLMLLAVSHAVADTELVVLGPVGSNGDVGPVKAALVKAKVGTLAANAIAAPCATDPGCLVKAGAELTARRVLGVSVTGGGKMTITLVDVGTKLLLGTKDLTFAPAKLDKELGPTLARFVEEIPVDKAKALFAEGNQHFNLGEYAPALERYKVAYRVKPLAAFQFNIAQCHRKLGQYQEAIAMYQAFLVATPDAPNKVDIESLIAESKKALAERTSAAAKLESERLATEQKKAEEARKAKEAEASAVKEQSKTEQARIAAERERDKTYNRHPVRKWMLVTGGLGLASAGMGAYFGARARAAQRSFDDAGCGDPSQLLDQAALATCLDDRDRGQQSAFVSNALIGAGAAVVLTSLVVFIIDPGNLERPSPNRPAVAVTPTAVKVSFQW